MYGRQPLPRKEVIRKMGELMTLRMAVNTTGGGLDDTPEVCFPLDIGPVLTISLSSIGLNPN